MNIYFAGPIAEGWGFQLLILTGAITLVVTFAVVFFLTAKAIYIASKKKDKSELKLMLKRLLIVIAITAAYLWFNDFIN